MVWNLNNINSTKIVTEKNISGNTFETFENIPRLAKLFPYLQVETIKRFAENVESIKEFFQHPV